MKVPKSFGELFVCFGLFACLFVCLLLLLLFLASSSEKLLVSGLKTNLQY